ncbi:hypothetical protein BV898_06419 [Hypsibius exemplaris]|uniref:CCHC-type domain-containing protein n=1 Tax=Hypsibius exemplaris TaxID=2072580 RepID=A0A1W0WWR8_HYPEX|nr:hypothetical protein BV898_06419 [Hypsibius exemplaris]
MSRNLKNVGLTATELGMTDMRVTASGKTVATFSDADACRKAEVRLNSNKAALEIERVAAPTERKPRIIVGAVPKQMKEEDLLDAMCAQCNVPKTEMSVIKKLTSRDETLDNCALVIETSGDARSALLAKERFFIDTDTGFFRCSIADHHYIPQCFKCWHYGHTQVNCRQKDPRCGKCAG